MLRRPILVPIFLFLSTGISSAQFRCPQSDPRTQIQVRVYYDNGRPAGQFLRVVLLSTSFAMIDNQFTDTQGGVTFIVNSNSGATYRLKITGDEIEEYNFERGFEIAPCQPYHYENVTVKLKDGNNPQGSTQGTISEAQLNIPEKARNEFEKGAKAMEKKDMEKARAYMTRATEIYPRYAEAFNVLGVIAMNTNQLAEGRTFFERAIQADDKQPAAYVNMAKILMGEHHLPEAVDMVTKSIAIDPRNPESQSLLCYFQMLQGKFVDAAATAKLVHGLPHERFVMVHYMAATALERQQRPLEAIEEYKLYIKEAQSGPQVEKARAAMVALERPSK